MPFPHMLSYHHDYHPLWKIAHSQVNKPGCMKLKISTRSRVDEHIIVVPMFFSRKSNQSFAITLWKLMLRLVLMHLIYAGSFKPFLLIKGSNHCKSNNYLEEVMNDGSFTYRFQSSQTQDVAKKYLCSNKRIITQQLHHSFDL